MFTIKVSPTAGDDVKRLAAEYIAVGTFIKTVSAQCVGSGLFLKFDQNRKLTEYRIGAAGPVVVPETEILRPDSQRAFYSTLSEYGFDVIAAVGFGEMSGYLIYWQRDMDAVAERAAFKATYKAFKAHQRMAETSLKFAELVADNGALLSNSPEPPSQRAVVDVPAPAPALLSFPRTQAQIAQDSICSENDWQGFP